MHAQRDRLNMSSDSDQAADETQSSTAVADSPEKLALIVDIQTVGPCRKHVKVTVLRADIDRILEKAVKEFVSTAAVPGFRPGRVPRKLVEKRFKKEVAGQVKQNVLLTSLEQVSEDNKLQPISQPDLDVDAIELPETGDLHYEFDVEVRPEFKLPKYKGVTIKRPVRTIGPDEISRSLNWYLEQHGQLVPHDGPAEKGDILTVTIHVRHGEQELSRSPEQTVRVLPTLRFQDAEIQGFDQLMSGIRAGESRDAQTTVSIESPQLELRGETVQVRFQVAEVKRLRLPELNSEFLQRVGFDSEEALRKRVLESLERQVEYQQRQQVRVQVLEFITESSDWDLPETLVRRQVENALRREMLEMQQAGFSDREIRARENELRQKSVSTTRRALKEHFVLDQIATEEKIQVTPVDVDLEVTLMALQRGESSRKVRAQLEKRGLIDNLTAQLLEKKAVDVILENAKYEDVPLSDPPENEVEALSISVCGQQAETTEASQVE